MMRLTMVLRTYIVAVTDGYIYIGNKHLFRFSDYYGLITSDPDFNNVHNFQMCYEYDS